MTRKDRPGAGRNNPRPGQRSTKANPSVSGPGTGRGTPHPGRSPHGRQTRPPSGASGKGTAKMVAVGAAIFALPALGFLSAIGYVVWKGAGNG